MVKHILLKYDDHVFDRLKEAKGSMSWEAFFVSRSGIGSPDELGIST